MTRVSYIARNIPHYRQRILERLGEIYDLQVLSGGLSLGLGREAELSQLERVPLKEVRAPFGCGKLCWQEVREGVKRFHPEVVITEFGLSLMHLHWLRAVRKSMGFSLTHWTHGMGVDYRGPASSIGDRWRIHLLKAADGLFYYTEGCRSALASEVGDEVPSWVVWNTLDTVTLNREWEALEAVGPPCSEPYVVYLGRLTPSKRVEILPELVERLHQRQPNVRWKIIGSGEHQELLKAEMVAKRLPVDFLGPIIDERIKGNWLKHAAAMVCPGMLGLNVVDAFGYGCPVLSFADQPTASRHSPEVEYLREGANGWLATSRDALVAKLADLVTNPELRKKIGQSARRTFESECQIERQLAGFIDGIGELCPGKSFRHVP